jgi:hypothetical protein
VLGAVFLRSATVPVIGPTTAMPGTASITSEVWRVPSGCSSASTELSFSKASALALATSGLKVSSAMTSSTLVPLRPPDLFSALKKALEPWKSPWPLAFSTLLLSKVVPMRIGLPCAKAGMPRPAAAVAASPVSTRRRLVVGGARNTRCSGTVMVGVSRIR